GRVKVDACSASPPGRPGDRTADRTRPRTPSAPGCGQVSGRSPPSPGCPPPRRTPRLWAPAAVQGIRWLVLLGLAGGLDGPLDQPRRPLPTIRPQPVELGVDLIGALGEAAAQRLRHPPEF